MIAEIRKLSSNPRYHYLLDCGELDLRLGVNAREYRLCSKGRGAILKATIDKTNMFYSLGEVPSTDFEWINGFKGKGELHFEPHQASEVAKIRKPHMSEFSDVRFYYLKLKSVFQRCEQVQSLGAQDFPVIQTFMTSLYAGTSFVRRMLQFPFFGIFENQRLVSTGGIIYLNQEKKSCQIGSFLTHPDFRGRGYCRKIMNHLLAELAAMGILDIRLEVYDSNVPAWKGYESLGFEVEKWGVEMLISDPYARS